MAYKRKNSRKRRPRKGSRRKGSRKRRKMAYSTRKTKKIGARFASTMARASRYRHSSNLGTLNDYTCTVVHANPLHVVHPNAGILESPYAFDDLQWFGNFTLDSIEGDNFDLYNLGRTYKEFRVKKVQYTFVANPMLVKGHAGPVGRGSRASSLGAQEPDRYYATDWGKYCVYTHDPNTIPIISDNTAATQQQLPVNDVINKFRKFAGNSTIRNHNKSFRITMTPTIQSDLNSGGTAQSALRRNIKAPWLSIQHQANTAQHQGVEGNNQTMHYGAALFSSGTNNSNNESNTGYKEYGIPALPTTSNLTVCHWASFTVYTKFWIEFRGATMPTQNRPF